MRECVEFSLRPVGRYDVADLHADGAREVVVRLKLDHQSFVPLVAVEVVGVGDGKIRHALGGLVVQVFHEVAEMGETGGAQLRCHAGLPLLVFRHADEAPLGRDQAWHVDPVDALATCEKRRLELLEVRHA